MSSISIKTREVDGMLFIVHAAALKVTQWNIALPQAREYLDLEVSALFNARPTRYNHHSATSEVPPLSLPVCSPLSERFAALRPVHPGFLLDFKAVVH